MFNFPIVDLKRLDSSKSEKEELRRGLTDVGFFYVKNWGLTNAELEEIETLTRQVFTASDAEQNKLASYVGEMAHSFYLFDMDSIFVQQVDPNLKLDVKKIDEKFWKMFLAMKNTGLELLTWFEKIFDLKEGRLRDQFASDPVCCLHGNYYDKTPKGEWGIESHLDKGLITLLYQDQTGGLEAEYEGKWYPIPPIEGTLIINLGRMLEYFTHGVAKGAWHRVKAHKGDRISWPFFLNPSFDAKFGRLDEFKWNAEEFEALEKKRRINVSGTYEPGTEFGSGTYRDWHNKYVVNADEHRRNKGHLKIWEMEEPSKAEVDGPNEKSSLQVRPNQWRKPNTRIYINGSSWGGN